VSAQIISGSSGAPGLAIGPLVHLAAPATVGSAAADDARSAGPGATGDLRPASSGAAGDPRLAAERLAAAQAAVAGHLEHLGAELQAAGKPDEAAIFDAQALLASDPALAKQALQIQAADGVSLAAAVRAAAERVARSLAALDDAYLSARAEDVRGVGRQIAAVLDGAPLDAVLAVPAGAIVLAAELTPADLVRLHRRGVGGVVTAGGTSTGHVAILARGLGLPALVGAGKRLQTLPPGVPAVLDAGAGLLLVAPSDDERAGYEARRRSERERQAQAKHVAHRPARLADGQRVRLWANIGQPDEAAIAVQRGAEGVGLFRTEFLFLDRAAPPGEEEQFAAYVQTLRAVHGRPLVVRTLDVGGDKPLDYLALGAEANPFLGWRGIRCLRRVPKLFMIQVRALLRAAAVGDVRIMLPMVATPDDVAWARQQVLAAAAALAAQGVPHRADVPLGIMVETPAAAVGLDRLVRAGGLTFCSIGSNDLAQYTLAADRGEPTLGALYAADDPAVFRMIRLAASAARTLGLSMSVCGELAARPASAVALVGLGIDILSLASSAVAPVKDALSTATLADARAQAAQACDDREPTY